MSRAFLFLGLILIATVASGCGNKKTEEASLDSDAILEEIETATQEGVVTVGDAQSDQIQSLDETTKITGGKVKTLSAASVPASTMTIEKPTTEQIQQALYNANLYTGKIDGVSGPMTKRAVREFQSQNGLTADGKVGHKTWGKLAPYFYNTGAVSPDTSSSGM